MANRIAPSPRTSRAAPSPRSRTAGAFGKAEVEEGRTSPARKGEKKEDRTSPESFSRKEKGSKRVASLRATKAIKEFTRKQSLHLFLKA